MKSKELLSQALNYLDHPAKGLSASVDIAIDNLKEDIKKKIHGGQRPNSGRKKGAETTTVSFRVRVDQADAVKELIKKYLNK